MNKNQTLEFIIIFGISFWLCSMNIGGSSIYVLDEAKNATCAREMWEQREWIVPTFNYELRGDKPPLHYYFMILSYRIFGVSEWSARFFSAIMGACTMLITFAFSKKYLNPKAAWVSVMILWASIHFTLQFHLAVPDPYLIFFLTATLLLFFDFIHDRKPFSIYLMYLCVAMGVLSKGPVAIALPGLVMLLYLVFSNRLNWVHIRSFRILQGVFIVICLTVPWFWLVHVKTDGVWTEEFFFKHNFERYTQSMEGHGGIFFLTPLFVLVGMLPFSVFVIQAFRKAWTWKKSHELLLLSVIQIVSFVAFFSISSTKLPNYTVPVYPFLAIITGYYIAGKPENHSLSVGDKWSLGVYILLSILIPIGAYIGLSQDRLLSDLNYYAWLWLAIPIGSIIALYYVRSRAFYLSGVRAIVLSWILASGLFYYIIFPKLDQANPVAKNIHLFEKSTPVAQYQFINRSFNFYIRKPIPRLQTPEEVIAYWKKHPDGYIITREKYVEELSGVPQVVEIAKDPDLFEKYTTVILALDKSSNLK